MVHPFEQNREDIPSILERFEQDFDNIRFREEAEIIHVIGIGLWLSDIQQGGWPETDVIARLKNYINLAYSGRTAGPDDFAPSSDVSLFGDGAYGLRIQKPHRPAF